MSTYRTRGNDSVTKAFSHETGWLRAVYHDDLPAATLLVKAGASVKVANRYGVTPLSLTCANGNTQIVELLLKAGADPSTTLRGGETALMTAARTGKPGPVKALLARGADVNAKERKGQSALMWAAADGHVDVVATLLAAGADCRYPNVQGLMLYYSSVKRMAAARALGHRLPQIDTKMSKTAPVRGMAGGRPRNLT